MKSIYLIFILAVGLTITSSNTKHEYYVSVTNIEYAKEQQSVQIISQIFIDDFETLIRQRYDETIILAETDEPEIVDEYMKRYLEDKLKIKINEKTYKFNFLGKEYKEDITYCYLEIENVKDIKSVSVVNRILFDVLPDQQNIVRLKMLDKNKSFLLIPENDECMLNFN